LKEYFFRKVGKTDFSVYSATLDKISVCRGFSPEKRQDI